MSDRRSHSWSLTAAFIVVLTGSVICAAVTTRALNRSWWATDSPPPNPEPRSVRISRSDLFPGDLKHLAPHLGLATAGSVRLDVTGPDLMIGMEVEVYRKGKPPRSPGSGRSRHTRSVEASISLREIVNPGGQRQYQLVTASTGQSESAAHTTLIDVPDGGRGVSSYFTSHLSEPGPRALAEGERVAAWAYIAYEDLSRRNVADSLVAEAKQGQWAIVLWVWWDEIKDH